MTLAGVFVCAVALMMVVGGVLNIMEDRAASKKRARRSK